MTEEKEKNKLCVNRNELAYSILIYYFLAMTIKKKPFEPVSFEDMILDPSIRIVMIRFELIKKNRGDYTVDLLTLVNNNDIIFASIKKNQKKS